ncbi:DUF397 domain-containing protein [Streptomyces sp. NBC_01171]|uniref:DUF397 domain-containing protein n=1 Tax=Streptomyces sp. NBC_01171 TaxID=2903757 RepID=UPI0038641669|nr:DUF397 domain-containing protein [Streptomyces sp. NBC_01171]
MQNSSEGLIFVKSSYSVQNACVEVAALPDGGRAVRDSKNPNGPVHFFNREEWDAFVLGAKDGQFDN